MPHFERLLALARQILQINDEQGRADCWLWEHSERVMRLAGTIAELPEVGTRMVDRNALAIAALFHDAGWAVQARQGKFDRWQILSRPTSDIQRELGAALLVEQAGHLAPSETLRRATDAIRQCNERNTRLLEAQILAEAESLDEIGLMYVLRQFRQFQAEGRPLEQLVNSWARQKEYQYWEARLNDNLRFQATRRLARERLRDVDALIQALNRDLTGADLREAVAAVPPARETRSSAKAD